MLSHGWKEEHGREEERVVLVDVIAAAKGELSLAGSYAAGKVSATWKVVGSACDDGGFEVADWQVGDAVFSPCGSPVMSTMQSVVYSLSHAFFGNFGFTVSDCV